MQWFPGGPRVDTLPLPIPDPSRPWGSTNCTTCSGFCSGHYMGPEGSLQASAAQRQASVPPSTLLKDFFIKSGPEPSEIELEEIAKKCLLPLTDVSMWLNHLHTINENRKRGAAKAAETRRKKKYPCGVCGAIYGESEEVELWVACDNCNVWFHGDCVGITRQNEPDQFFGASCV